MSITEKLTAQKVVCPWWLCFTFDNPLRRLLHDPSVMLSPYVHAGDRVMDVGCGMGYFTVPLAGLVGGSGHVIAVDIQERMLAVLNRRAQKKGISERITTHLAGPESLGIDEKVDFVLVFWMLHEVPDQGAFLVQIRNQLKPDGLLLLAEPFIHVPAKYFSRTLQIAADQGFAVRDRPRVRFSHTALMGIV